MTETEVDLLYGSDEDQRVQELKSKYQDMGFSDKILENLARGVAAVDFEMTALSLSARYGHRRALIKSVSEHPGSEMLAIAVFQEAVREEFRALQATARACEKRLILEFTPNTQYFCVQFPVKPTKEQLEPIDQITQKGDLSIGSEFPVLFNGYDEPGVCLAIFSDITKDQPSMTSVVSSFAEGY